MALLPLFPLDLVLLPGTPLPLHIFEPRYKEMIGECLANQAPFGVVRATEEGFAEVGCTAEIVSVTKEYPDGRMDLVAEGRQRFEVLELNRERSFLQAEIRFMPDESGDASPDDKARAIQGAPGDSVPGRSGARSFRRRPWHSFVLSRRFSSTRSRLQAETARDAVGEPAHPGGRGLFRKHSSQPSSRSASARKGRRERARPLVACGLGGSRERKT